MDSGGSAVRFHLFGPIVAVTVILRIAYETEEWEERPAQEEEYAGIHPTHLEYSQA